MILGVKLTDYNNKLNMVLLQPCSCSNATYQCQNEVGKIEEAWGCGSYSGIGAAEAAEAPMGSPVEPKKWEYMDMQAITHGLELLIVDLKKHNIRVLLCKLANLHQRKRILILEYLQIRGN